MLLPMTLWLPVTSLLFVLVAGSRAESICESEERENQRSVNSQQASSARIGEDGVLALVDPLAAQVVPLVPLIHGDVPEHDCRPPEGSPWIVGRAVRFFILTISFGSVSVPRRLLQDVFFFFVRRSPWVSWLTGSYEEGGKMHHKHTHHVVEGQVGVSDANKEGKKVLKAQLRRELRIGPSFYPGVNLKINLKPCDDPNETFELKSGYAVKQFRLSIFGCRLFNVTAAEINQWRVEYEALRGVDLSDKIIWDWKKIFGKSEQQYIDRIHPIPADFVERVTHALRGGRVVLSDGIVQPAFGRAGDVSRVEAFVRVRMQQRLDPEKVEAADVSMILYGDVHLHAPPSRDVLENYWFVGGSGTGKSRSVRELYPGVYEKLKNQWWDGYTRQPNIVIEEWDPRDYALNGDLKRWTDHYSFTAEVKGGMVCIRPKRVFVTSNYTIEECFGVEGEDP